MELSLRKISLKIKLNIEHILIEWLELKILWLQHLKIQKLIFALRITVDNFQCMIQILFIVNIYKSTKSISIFYLYFDLKYLKKFFGCIVSKILKALDNFHNIYNVENHWNIFEKIFSKSSFFINGTTYPPNHRQTSEAKVGNAKSYQIFAKVFLDLTFRGVVLVPPIKVVCHPFCSAEKRKTY